MESKHDDADKLEDSGGYTFTYEGLFNTKQMRVGQCSAEELPKAYGENNRKEELCLGFVDNFVRQFEVLFPQRRKLFLTPLNELGVPKFVCTTIRPTQLPFKALYNAGTCAEFFSHFMQYEPLEDATQAPMHLPSPSFTLESQMGDCFDLSTLLCSYLVGSGYDAYCVYGTAPKDVTLLNRTRESCPLLSKKELLKIEVEEDTEELNIEDLRTPEERGVGREEKTGETELEDGDIDQFTEGGGAENTASGEGTSESKEDESPRDSTAEGASEGKTGDEQKSGENNDGEHKMDDENDADANDDDANDDEVGNDEGEVSGGLVEAIGEEDESGDPYAVLSTGVKESQYYKQMKARDGNEEENKYCEDSDEEDEQPDTDPLQGKRVHCWILVRAGKRAVEESFFIEPSTGRLYNVYGSPYTSIEAVWNNKNYWINMQQKTEGNPMNISYNLEAEELWEFIFLDSIRPNNTRSTDAGEQDAHAGGHHHEDEPHGDGIPPEGEGKESDESSEVLDLPPSWVKKLVLTREAYRRRYNTTGQRTQLFYKSKLESHAEHLHVHGLIKRLVIFKDIARTLPIEVREYFANRRDKLTLRVRYPLQGRIIEHFEEGRLSGLKTIDEIVGRSRDIHFYNGSRLDGLIQRAERIGKKLVEHFVGRDDHLETRSIKLVQLGEEGEGDGEGNDDDQFGHASGEKKNDVGVMSKTTMTLPRAQQGGDLVILKMKQVFSRNTDVIADADIAKRTFYLSAGTISVIFHYEKNKITRSSRLFYKDTSVSPEIKLAGTFAQPLRPSQIEEEFQRNLQAEKDCYQSIRDSEREIQDILALRKREESTIVLEKSIFDRARENSKHDAIQQAESQVQVEKDPRHVDYLTPFLQHIPELDKIRVEEAEAARDACLKSLKERLLERANIIQCRLDEENAQLAKKQAAFQRSRDHVDGADQEFERFCSEAMFRIQILEQRLARHEESALSIYANLDQKLRSDPRLSVLAK